MSEPPSTILTESCTREPTANSEDYNRKSKAEAVHLFPDEKVHLYGIYMRYEKIVLNYILHFLLSAGRVSQL